MKFVPVNSSTIKEVGYDYDKHYLYVNFHGDREYVYADVPVDVYAKFLEADSKGKYLHEAVVGKFNYTRMK